MSLKIVKTLALDFTREAPLEYIFVKAGDKDSRVLDITPLNSGLAYAIPEGAKVVFAAKKPDKTEILNDASVNTKTGHIEVTLSEQTLAAEGLLVCEVGLYNSAGEFLSSQHFYLKASPSALTDIESSNEYKSLVVALLAVDAKVREAEDAISKAEEAAKTVTDALESGELGNTREVAEKVLAEHDASALAHGDIRELIETLAANVYDKEAVDRLVSLIPKLNIEPVEALPALESASLTAFYLVPSGEGESDVYTEWFCVEKDGVRAWERLGTQKMDLSGYATTEAMNTAIANAISDALVGYVTGMEVDGKISGALSGYVDTAALQTALTEALKEYAKTTAIPTKLSQLESDATHRTVTDAEKKVWNEKAAGDHNHDERYQVKGNYQIAGNYAAEGHTHDGAYATVEQLAERLSVNQGAANAGKILVVGTDGKLTLTDMPEGGASGDVTGTLDGSYNILLSGNLPVGTYTLSFVNEDGTYSGAGKLEVVEIAEPEEIINQIPISVDSSGAVYNGTGYKSGVRLKSDAVTESTDIGTVGNCVITGHIPVISGDVIRTKNITFGDSSTGYISFMWLYDSSFEKVGVYNYTTNWNYTIEDGIYTTTIPSDVSGVAYMRLQAQVLDDTSIVTVNQEIV